MTAKNTTNQKADSLPCRRRVELLDPQQVADWLGVKKTTLAIWRSEKTYRLPYVEVGGRIKYKLTDVEAFIDSRTVAA